MVCYYMIISKRTVQKNIQETNRSSNFKWAILGSWHYCIQ